MYIAISLNFSQNAQEHLWGALKQNSRIESISLSCKLVLFIIYIIQFFLQNKSFTTKNRSRTFRIDRRFAQFGACTFNVVWISQKSDAIERGERSVDRTISLSSISIETINSFKYDLIVIIGN